MSSKKDLVSVGYCTYFQQGGVFLLHFLNELRNNLIFGKMTEVPLQFC